MAGPNKAQGKNIVKTRRVSKAASAKPAVPVPAAASTARAARKKSSIGTSATPQVRGRISYSDGRLARDVLVTVVERDLRTAREIGQIRTGPDGEYRLAYDSGLVAQAEAGGADLVVSVTGADGQVMQSPIHFNAGPDAVIDLVLPAGELSEWERLGMSVLPLLEGQGVAPGALTESDLDFITADASLDRERLRVWSWATKAANERPLLAGLTSGKESHAKPRQRSRKQDTVPAASGVDWQIYFAWGRGLGETDTAALLRRETSQLVETLRTAVKANVVPGTLLAQLERLAKILDGIRRDMKLEPAAAGAQARLADVLDVVEAGWLGVDLRHRVADLLTTADPAAPDFEALAVKAGLKGSQALTLTRTLRLAKLADDHLPMITALHPLVSKDKDASLGSLARMDTAHWLDLTYQHGAPLRDANEPERFALRMRDAVEKAAPEATLRARAEAGDLRVTLPGYASIGQFLANNPSFSFARDDVEETMSKADLSGIKESREAVGAALAQMQMLKRIGARWDETPAFVQAGIDSFESLAQHGTQGLVQILGDKLDADRLTEVAQNIRILKSVGAGLMNQMLPMMSKAGTEVMEQRVKGGAGQEFIDQSPSLRRLFGALDQCACDPCQSVLSPSAYLVDLLRFVTREPRVALPLLERRPDLFDLELSCDNAQIELPHIDLVNELLENAIVFPMNVAIRGDVLAALRHRPIPAELMAALQSTTWEPLTESNLGVEIIEERMIGITRVVIFDRYRRWTLEVGDPKLTFHGASERLPVDRLDIMAASLDAGKLLTSAQLADYFARHARGLGTLPVSAPEVEVKPIEPGRRWQLKVTAAGRVWLDKGGKRLMLSAADGTSQQPLKASSAGVAETLKALERGRMGGMLLSLVSDPSNYQMRKVDDGTWEYVKVAQLWLRRDLGGVVITGLTYQSTSRDRDLFARPQHRNPRTYAEFLAKPGAVFPWSLPFDVDLAETRALLAGAGTGRAEWMRAAFPPGGGVQGAEWAIERLSLSRPELTLLTTAAPAADVWKLWGLTVSNGSATLFDSYLEANRSGQPIELLSPVSIVLQQGRLSFVDLTTALTCPFVNPGNYVRIVPIEGLGIEAECDPAKLKLKDSTAEFFDRLHRFLRWQRRLKWTLRETDLALRMVTARHGANANGMVTALAQIEELRVKLGVSVEILLTAFYGFDRVSYPQRSGDLFRSIEPLYERTFQNPDMLLADASGTRTPDVALAFGNLSSTASTLTFSERESMLAAALGMRAHEMLPLLNADWPLLHPSATVSGASRLTVEHLQCLLRSASLVRALRVSPARYVSLVELLGSSPFVSPGAMLEFCARADYLALAKASYEKLRYVLTHRGPRSYAWVLSDEQAQRGLANLQLALRSAAEQFVLVPESLDIPPESLATLLDSGSTRVQRLALLQDLTQLAPDALVRVIGSLWPNFSDAFASESRVRSLMASAIVWQRRAAVVVTAVSHEMGIPAPLVEALLWQHLSASRNRAAMEWFADPGSTGAVQRFEDESRVFEVATVAAQPEYAAWLKLWKFGLLNAEWKLSPKELARFPTAAANPGAMRGLVLDALPASEAPGDFSAWQRASVWLELSRGAAGLSTVVDDYARALTGADPLAAGAAVWAAALELPIASVRGFVSSDLLAFGTSPTSVLDDCRDPLRVNAWYELMLLARRHGIGSTELRQLVAAAPGRPAIDAAVRALQGRIGEPQWRQVMVKAGNALRMEQRDRLVDYLLWRDRLRDADALYERYLIDTQMAPCMNTTRLLQAVAAVQLYVQRCLMNLEYAVSPALVDPDRQWEWRKNYRVWEANRKIFLFPQNWLHPELRDDKSEIFRSYESDLMQSEASEPNTARAVQGYLEALTEVAQISIMGMYEESPPAASAAVGPVRKYKTLHVVGRSPDPPYTYFYRTNERHGDPGSYWTPWQRISLDLPSGHVAPFVMGGELYIVWPVVEIEKEAETKKEYYNIKLAWARRTTAGWTQRKVANESATRIEKHFSRDERGSLAVRLNESQSDARHAVVELYVARKTPSAHTEASISANHMAGGYEYGPQTLTWWSNWRISARAFVKYRDTGRIVPLSGATFRIVGLSLHSPSYGYDGSTHYPVPYAGDDMGMTPDAGLPGLPADGSQNSFVVHNDTFAAYFQGTATVDGRIQVVNASDRFEFTPTVLGQRGSGWAAANLMFYADKDSDFDDPAVSVHARVKMDRVGCFWFETGRDTRWIPDSVQTPLAMPVEALSWESRFRERDNHTAYSVDGLSDGSQMVFRQSQMLTNYVAQRASRAPGSTSNTWYWEESASGRTVRYLRISGVPNEQALVNVQPAAFDEAREYRYRYAIGPDHLFTPETQTRPGNASFNSDLTGLYFNGNLPQGVAATTLPLLPFHLGMPYGSYNWEVFYHVPIAAARFYASRQFYAEALRSLAWVFDPTTNDAATGRERFWRCLPLRHANTPLSIQQLMQALADPDAPAEIREPVQRQVAASIETPFSPFAIARVRNSAFEWYATITYVTTVLDWGDSLYRRDTRESISEATLLYALAAKILGRRPETIPKQGFQPLPMSFRALASKWDEFGNAWVRLADTPLGQALIELVRRFIPPGRGSNPRAYDELNAQIEQIMSVGALYFCIPQDEKLLALWDRVADRLWKIRHCRNIDGIERPLALLDPPIDPELLIRARLAGVDISDVLADAYAPPPHHRYTFLAQKAVDFCAELKSLGAELFAGIEKKDMEKLALLRQTHEIAMLNLVEAVRLDQVAETDANIEALRQTRANQIVRYRHLQRMLGNNDIRFDAQGIPVMEQTGGLQPRDTDAPGGFRGLGLIQSEIDQISKLDEAHTASMIAGGLKAAGAIGRAGAAVLYTFFEGPGNAAKSIAESIGALGDVADLISTDLRAASGRADLLARFQRRRDDTVQLAVGVVDQIREIDKQLIAAEIRRDIALKELANHRQSVENSREVDDYLRQVRFTSVELHAWRETQLLGTVHAAYQLAFDLAKRAERAWRRDLGERDSQWIRFGYWEGAKKGLLAGEQLHLDLNRMQSAWIERSKRELEITKHVSLMALDPGALVSLRETGNCTISIPEALFDCDFPGHYFRRLKTVALSVPCVVGPYGGVPATLKLLESTVRVDPSLGIGYLRSEDDPRFEDDRAYDVAVATSSGVNDSGLFEVNLREESILPGEYKGVISTWQLDLPAEFRPFDYNTISDVILHLRYTARDGGGDLKNAATASLTDALNQIRLMNSSEGLSRLFSLRRDFPMEWHRLTHPANADGDSEVQLRIAKNRFPFLFSARDTEIQVEQVDGLLVPAEEAEDPEFPKVLELVPPGEEEGVEWEKKTSIAGLPGYTANVEVSIARDEASAIWRLRMPSDSAGSLRELGNDVLLVFRYKLR